ncbi:flagellar hook-length control protein FliK [Sphingosinicella soli]|uniref:Flagellar hook-length control protein FliK n=1 Tax=Sphingosinicella soli TaxID=333708 RepID=A0A7W7B2I7_9SPHN|nr:flagellar hook-length control protein FliK [Sphingosinicella soli]MBB4632817.1 flagellar hook-length control protein FliK [Sphingosinicella soli]
MSVNATGLGELPALPELSLQTAARPGIPASAPDFLSIMALKTAPPAKAGGPGPAVGLPSAGDGNPTSAKAQPAVPAVAVPAVPAASDETAESDRDMAIDLPLPAMPSRRSVPSEPKAPGGRFAAVAARYPAPAEPATVPKSATGADSDADAEAGDEDTPAVITPEARIVPQAAQPAVPIAAPFTAPVPPPPAETAVSDSDQTSPAPTPAPTFPTPEPSRADQQGVPARSDGPPPFAQTGGDTPAADAQADTAMPLTVAGPAMQRPPISERPANLEATEAADTAALTPGTLAGAGTESEAVTLPAPLRDAVPASQTPQAVQTPQMGQAVLAAIHDAAPGLHAPERGDVSPGQAAQAEALLDDLFIGAAGDEAWVDQLAADVETLVRGDRREAQLHLKPRELGDLFIRLETNGNQARVHFTVETAAAQGFITDAAPRLHSMMETRGVRLEEASVDVGGGRQDRGEQPRETPADPLFGSRPRSAASQAETLRTLVRQTAIERFA